MLSAVALHYYLLVAILFIQARETPTTLPPSSPTHRDPPSSPPARSSHRSGDQRREDSLSPPPRRSATSSRRHLDYTSPPRRSDDCIHGASTGRDRERRAPQLSRNVYHRCIRKDCVVTLYVSYSSKNHLGFILFPRREIFYFFNAARRLSCNGLKAILSSYGTCQLARACRCLSHTVAYD